MARVAEVTLRVGVRSFPVVNSCSAGGARWCLEQINSHMAVVGRGGEVRGGSQRTGRANAVGLHVEVGTALGVSTRTVSGGGIRPTSIVRPAVISLDCLG